MATRPKTANTAAEDHSGPPSIRAILAQRGARYGVFKQHAEVTQRFKNLLTEELVNREKLLEPSQQEALEMIFHKIGCIVNGDPNYSDSWRDIAGYAALVADELDGVER